MFYDPRVQDHGLPHNPFNSLVVPRPIAWVTTLNADGSTNLAPFSHFNVCSTEPPAIMFGPGQRSCGGPKDTPANILRAGEFVVNIVPAEMSEQMNITSAELDSGDDEAVLAGVDLLESRNVAPPSITQCPVSLECALETTVTLEGQGDGMIVIGRVIGVRIEDRVLTDGRIDVRKLRPLARLGYFEYAVVEDSFTLPRPDQADVQHWRDRQIEPQASSHR